MKWQAKILPIHDIAHRLNNAPYYSQINVVFTKITLKNNVSKPYFVMKVIFISDIFFHYVCHREFIYYAG